MPKCVFVVMLVLAVASLSGLNLLAGEQADGATQEVAPVLNVKLCVPRDMKFVEVRKILQKLETHEANKWSLLIAKENEPLSAEIVADPKVASKRVAAVVEELLNCAIRKISIEPAK